MLHDLQNKSIHLYPRVIRAQDMGVSLDFSGSMDVSVGAHLSIMIYFFIICFLSLIIYLPINYIPNLNCRYAGTFVQHDFSLQHSAYALYLFHINHRTLKQVRRRADDVLFHCK